MIKLLNELDEKRIIECKFQSFKDGFRVPFSYDPQLLPLLGEIRNHLEGVMILKYDSVKDAAKKHQWLCQKINDVLRVNSILLKKQELERKIKLTASEQTIEDTTGERRFNEVTTNE